MLVVGESLAHDLLDGIPPLDRHLGEVIGVHEPLHPTLTQAPRQGVPPGEDRLAQRPLGIKGRCDQPQPRHTFRVAQGEAQDGVRAH